MASEGEVAPAPARLLEGEALAYAVMGVLCLHQSVRPETPVPVQAELAKLGMACDTSDLEHAVRWLRRRGIEITGQRGRTGYVITDWLAPLARLDWQSTR